jgi:hypothetical protein
MRDYELECVHGIGHSAGLHGCDGCCLPLTKAASDTEIRMQAAMAAAVIVGAKGFPLSMTPEIAEKFVRYIKEGPECESF